MTKNETKLICALTEKEISTILHVLQLYADRNQTTDEIESEKKFLLPSLFYYNKKLIIIVIMLQT